ncbi:MAG TPA: phosphate ABC transporter permease PstA [Candidatus Dormibacteraeota bacterium]|nr:phosphate ABC transporter permease PstA [Candidatus Dormibacteraeota bacterium]
MGMGLRMTRNRRRLLANMLARGAMWLMACIALLPLSLLLIYTVANGLPALTHLEFFTNVERPVGIPGAGVAHAFVGTVIMVGVASLMAIPVGVVSGIQLVEYGTGRLGDLVRLACDVLVGIPSIVIGLFIFSLLVAPFHSHSALSASAALAVLMLPVVVRTTESAVALVPGALREAGLALGLPRWRVGLQLILPAAVPGVVTGALLAVARAAGETAPLLFTAFGNRFMNFDPTKAMAALPLIVFHDALTPYPDLVQTAWGAALVLIVLTLLVNVASRVALRRQISLAAKL